uniref:Secreted protein n=1 Tax=Ixodes scapularis TaxID=6945 RepID=A0A4D5S3P5_IXOSC
MTTQVLGTFVHVHSVLCFFCENKKAVPPVAYCTSRIEVCNACGFPVSRAGNVGTRSNIPTSRDHFIFFLSNCRPFRFFETSLPTSILPATIAF